MDRQTKLQFEQFKAFHDGLASESSIDTTETPKQKRDRIAMLEADPEKWFAYYFKGYAKAVPAAFHIESTKRIVANPEWAEGRHWSRELAKSTRTMMEVIYLTQAGYPSLSAALLEKYAPYLEKGKLKKKNVIITSNSFDNAVRLLAPYQSNFEKNQRLINDYGEQTNIGSWEASEFITRTGASFRAVGAGQSPRGTRNEAIRPDVILIDDIDTDEDCRNPDIIEKRWKWIQEALIPTRSISGHLLLIICGNIIAEDCCVVRAQEFMDYVDIINIRDASGKSSWPEKNSEEAIDRVLSTISYESQQKEYYNNPMSAGKAFPEITWGKCPDISTLPFVVTYADPAPGNKDKPGARTTQGNSRKAVFTVGRKGNTYYIYRGFLDVMGTDRFIDCLYACRDYIRQSCLGKGEPAQYTLIENNSLQDPFYDQVYRPAILRKGAASGDVLAVLGDERKKPEKWFRIEGTLEPLNKVGNLVFNIDEKDNEHMKRLAAQFKNAKPSSKQLDGPDCIEGAVYIINQKSAEVTEGAIRFGTRNRSRSKGY